MSRVAAKVLTAVLAAVVRTSGAAAEEPPQEAERRATDAIEPSADLSAWTSLRIGVVDAPYPSATLGEVRSEAGQARLLRFGAAARVAPKVQVGAHAAYVFAGVEQPAGSYRAGSAWGNPMLFAMLSGADLSERIGSKLDGDLSLSIGVPVAAERGPRYEQLDRRTLAIGGALEGWVNPEIYTPNVLPIALGGTLFLPRDYFQLQLGLELPLLVRLSEDTVPNGASTSAIGFIPNGELRVTTWPWHWLGLSLGSTVAWPIAQPVYLSSRRTAAQAMLTPRVLFALGGEALMSLDVAVAAGGPASGTASAALSARMGL